MTLSSDHEPDERVAPAGSPSNEIEVTPQMIEAGKAELDGYDLYWDSHEEIVSNIFTAMISAASGDTRKQGPS